MSYILPLFRVHIFLCLFLTLSLNAEQEFEQAYAPISVSGITIFVPIELYPDETNYLSIKETAEKYLLQWTDNSNSDYYVIERKVNNSWQLVADQVSTNEYQASKSYGDEFRVRGCHQYGCSDWTNVNNISRLPLQITSFYTNRSLVNVGDDIVVSWNVLGASEVNLKVNNTNYIALPFSGSKTLTLHDYALFELSTIGFGNTATQELAVVVNQPRVLQPVDLSGYLHPLENLGLDIIKRAILTVDNYTYVATQDGFMHKVNDQSQIVWSKNTNGVIANQPIISNGYLYYSVSLINGAGEICKTSILSAETICKGTGHVVIASPIINQVPSNSLTTNTQKSSKTSNLSDANKSLLSIDTSGVVTEYNLETLTVQNKFMLPTSYRNNSILSNVKISQNNELVLRTDNQVVALVIPSASSAVTSFFSKVQSFFTRDNMEVINKDIEVLNIAWEKELK